MTIRIFRLFSLVCQACLRSWTGCFLWPGTLGQLTCKCKALRELESIVPFDKLSRWSRSWIGCSFHPSRGWTEPPNLILIYSLEWDWETSYSSCFTMINMISRCFMNTYQGINFDHVLQNEQSSALWTFWFIHFAFVKLMWLFTN